MAPRTTSQASDDPSIVSQATAAYYDGACPLCAREIAFYRRRDRMRCIDWVDVSTCDSTLLPDGLTRATAMGRFHARLADGRLVSGGGAFVALWRTLPTFRRFGRMLSGRLSVRLLDWLYDRFLTIRPILRRLASPGRQSAK
jgi:predicted DCC family thiol-disulfide oxidoreductase YuxK